jgi:hypothetical protein
MLLWACWAAGACCGCIRAACVCGACIWRCQPWRHRVLIQPNHLQAARRPPCSLRCHAVITAAIGQQQQLLQLLQHALPAGRCSGSGSWCWWRL